MLLECFHTDTDMAMERISRSIVNEHWFLGLPGTVQELLSEAMVLVNDCEVGDGIVDFGYLVFPAAKAYEAYLKDFFFELELISEQSYRGDHFRIGKALNPDLPKKYRDHEWLYERVARTCGKDLGKLLWRTWRRGRNRVFHYNPDDPDGLSFDGAVDVVRMILSTIEEASRCEVRAKPD